MKSAIELVDRSYGNCCVSGTFLDDFYKIFLSTSPEIAKMFLKTDLTQQKQLLRSGIAHLLMSSKGKVTSVRKIEGLAKTHSRDQLNIRPELYNHWLRSLLAAIKKNDPEYSAQVEAAWREVLKPGIANITAGY